MIKQNKPLQELQMLSRSLSDCQSLSLKVMIRVSLFVWNSQLCDRVAESLTMSLSLSYLYELKKGLF